MAPTRTSNDKSSSSSAGSASAASEADAAGTAAGGDGVQGVLNASAAPTALLFSLGVELQRLQAEAFAATGKALETAMQEASRASQPQDLLKVQFDFVGASLERAANYNREWFARLAEAQAQLMGLAPGAAAGTAGVPGSPMAALNPADVLSRGPEAWTQLTRQWIDGLTRGAMPR